MSLILLVKPRFFSLEFRCVTPPVGMMYVASSLRAAGHSVRLFDCIEPDWKEQFATLLVNFHPDYIGVSMIVSEQTCTLELMGIVRSIAPDVPVIFGGAWPTTNPESAIRDLGADCVVLGEGEHTTMELIDAMNQGRPMASIAGTACLVDGSLVETPRSALTPEQLDALPYPAWDLVDIDLYGKRTSLASVGVRRYATVVTSRGCPFHCAYCHHTMGKKFRARTPGSILAEMAEIKNSHGISEFEILDDCFNLDRDRMLEILSQIPEKVGKVRLHFSNGVRSDRLEPEDMKVFRRAGTVSAYFAIETSSQRIQKLIHKNLNIERAERTIRAAVKEGIYSTGLFMLGFPTETYEEAANTVSLAVSLPLHRAFFMLVTPFPGTELAEMSAEKIASKNARLDDPNLNFYNNSINVSEMSDADLKKVFRSAYRRFYFHPSRIIRLIAYHPDKYSLPYYALVTLAKMIRKPGH